MQLKWTSKALSDLVRLYEFLAPVNRKAAAHTVQMLTATPTKLFLITHEPQPFLGAS